MSVILYSRHSWSFSLILRAMKHGQKYLQIFIAKGFQLFPLFSNNANSPLPTHISSKSIASELANRKFDREGEKRSRYALLGNNKND